MAGHAAVGVDDDLAAGETAVGVRAAELELAGRVHEHLEVVVGELLGQRRRDHVLDQRGAQLAVDADARVVLGRDEHGLEPLRHAVLVVDRHLRLAVGTQEVDDALLADLGEPRGQAVREPDRHRHEIVGLVARVAEHHALVARADLVVVVAGARLLLERLVDTHRDVGRLLVDRDDDAARLAVDAVLGVRVADLADGVAGEAGEVDVRLGADLTGDDARARS